MNIIFFWAEILGEFFPQCRSDKLNNYDVSPLACLLYDDGGVCYLKSIEVIDEGLREVLSVLRQDVVFSNWSRESWAANIEPSKVEVYSLYEKDCLETISINAFYDVLSSWREFLLSGPGDTGKIKRILPLI